MHATWAGWHTHDPRLHVPQGGAISAQGFNISIGSYSGFYDASDADVTFSGNYAKYGGAMSLSDGYLYCNATLSGNGAGDYAGAIELENMLDGILSG